jgi:dienelactone hydrolase
MRARITRSALLLTALLAAVTACDGGSAPAAAPGRSAAGSSAAGSSPAVEPPGPMPTVAPGAACLTAAERARTVRFASGNGASIAGVLLGSGPVGLVLAHQTNGDLCEWVPYARVLAARGYTALAIDMNGFGASQPSAGFPARPRYDQDLLAAAALLAGRGVTRVVLVGASLGGLAAVVAASEARPPVVAVVDLSGPGDMAGLNAVAAAGRVTIPLLCLTSEKDEYVDDVRAVAAAATRAPEHRLVVIPGSASHGITLIDPALEPQASAARSAIEAFLRDQAGRTG